MESQVKINAALLGLRMLSFCINWGPLESVLKMTIIVGSYLEKATEKNYSNFLDQTQS